MLALIIPVVAQSTVSGSTSLLTGRYNLSWTIDSAGGNLDVTIAAATTGWVAFGLASSGGMFGADMMIASVADSSGTPTIGDYWSKDTAAPLMDEQQDWTLQSSSQVSGVTTITARRALVTGDQQDWVVDAAMPNGQQIIAAMGASDVVSYHGVVDRIATKVNLFRPQDDLSDLMAPVRALPGVQSIDFFAQGVVGQAYCTSSTSPNTVSNNVRYVNTDCIDTVTDYTNLCINLASAGITSAAHVIAAEFHLEQANLDILHHFVVHGHTSTDCTDNGDLRAGDYIAEWAPGVDDFILPSDVGLLVGSGGYQSLGLNVHYNNVAHRAFTDHSGVRLWYTNTLRQHEMGVMAIGDPRVRGQYSWPTIPAGVSKYDFDCPSSVTSGLPHSLNVLYAQLHMHQSGIAMETVQYGSNGEYKRAHRTDHYSFNYQNFLQGSEYDRVTSSPAFTIEPGDRLHTTCWYNNDGRAGAVGSHRFGLASNDEMCITFFAYYPKVVAPGGFTWSTCGPYGQVSTYEGVTTKPAATSEDAFTNRSFGRPASLVAAEGPYAGGYATADETDGGTLNLNGCDGATFGALGVQTTVAAGTELQCDTLMDLTLAFSTQFSSRAQICSQWWRAQTVADLEGLAPTLGWNSYSPPDGASNLATMDMVCAATCCEAGACPSGCLASGRPDCSVLDCSSLPSTGGGDGDGSTGIIIIAAAVGVAAVLGSAVVGIAYYMKVVRVSTASKPAEPKMDA